MKNYPLYKLILILILFFPVISNAAFLRNVPVDLTQPDGKVIHCFATGDEYYNWVHDSNNFTIIQDNISGYYVYAKLVNDELFPTQYIVGKINPKTVGLKIGVNISSAKILKIRQNKLKQTPPKPKLFLNKNLQVQNVANTGTINNIVIFVRFSGENEFTDQKSVYSNMFNSTTSGYNSLHNYYEEVSYNSLSINSTFYPIPPGSTVISFQDSHPRSYYQPYNATTNPNGYTSGNQTSREHTLLQNAVNGVSSQIPISLNIDNDNDGYVDNVCFIIDGSPGAWNDLLWPHRWALYTLTVMINGKQVYDYNFQIQSMTLSSGVGVLCHEMFHTLGAPDLYHYSQDGKTPVGKWDIMEDDMNPPQHMGMYMKLEYGHWISSIPQITTPGTYTLNPVTSSTNNCYKIVSPNSTTEYFVLEYRRKTGTFESSVPGSGLIIYRINSAQAGNGNSNGPPDEVYIYRINGDTANDGIIDSAHFNLNSGRTVFNDYSNPHCFLSTGALGGLSIYNVTSAGSTISFTYGVSATSNPASSASSNPSVICQGMTTTLTLSGGLLGTGAAWKWYKGSCGGTCFGSGITITQSPSITSVYYVRAEGPANTTTCVSVTVTLNSTSLNPPLQQGFLTTTFPPSGWQIFDTNGDGVTWSLATSGGFGNSAYSSIMPFYNSPSGNKDEIMTPLINFSGASSANISFSVAYAQYTNENDTLAVMISTNCGSTWSTPYNKWGSTLSTTSATTTYFRPTSSQWRTENVNLTPFIGNSSVYIKFHAGSNYGNNVYIDDINITATISNLPSAGPITGPLNVCTGSIANYSVVHSAGVTYSWSAPVGWVGSSTSNSITYTTSTTSGNIKVIPTNSSGSGTASSVYVLVNLNSLPATSATVIPSSAICSGSTITLSLSGGSLSTGASWKWYSGTCGGTSLASGLSISQIPTIQTTYWVRAEGYCNTTVCVSVTVNIIGLPFQPGTISGLTTPSSGSIQVYSVTNVSGITYTWTAPSGWVGNSTSNSITYLVGNFSGLISVTPNNSCGAGIGRVLIVGVGGYQIHGNITYNNTNNTPLDSVIVILKLNNVKIDSVQADINGFYQFNNVPDGIYNISATTLKPWSGVNSTDAVKIKRHFSGSALFISSITLHAADVNLSYGINTTDAVKITRRFVGTDSTFTRGDWIFEKPYGGDTINVSVNLNDTVIVNGSNKTMNFTGICVGDVNGSYVPLPGAKVDPKVSLDCKDSIELNSNEYFELPIKVTNDFNIGAISLIMTYPKYLVTDISCQLSDNKGVNDFFYNNIGYELRIGWYENDDAVILKKNEPVIIIRGKTTGNFKQGEKISFRLKDDALCEFADENGEPFDNINLKTFSLVYKNSFSVSLSDCTNNDMYIYPNPSNEQFTIKFNKFINNSQLFVFNSIGQIIQIINLNTNTFNNQTGINISIFQKGIYFVRWLTDNNVIVKKVVVD